MNHCLTWVISLKLNLKFEFGTLTNLAGLSMHMLCVHVCMHRADGTNTCSIQTLQVCLYAARLCICSKVFLFTIDLEFISLNQAFQWGFHYHRGDIHLKWMPILFYRAFQMVFRTSWIRNHFFNAIYKIKIMMSFFISTFFLLSFCMCISETVWSVKELGKWNLRGRMGVWLLKGKREALVKNVSLMKMLIVWFDFFQECECCKVKKLNKSKCIKKTAAAPKNSKHKVVQMRNKLCVGGIKTIKMYWEKSIRK